MGKGERRSRTFCRRLRRYTLPDSETAKYRGGRMEGAVRRVRADLAERVFAEPEENLAALTVGTADPFLKVKIIHDWICDNISYDTDSCFNRAGRPQDYGAVLRNRTALCTGYSVLFFQLCSLAGMGALVINGYSKGFGYRGFVGVSTDHAWNAVKINGKWRLVDVTWDAGHVDYKTFIKAYSTAYLFPDSRSFLYSHLPAVSRFQFYAPMKYRRMKKKSSYLVPKTAKPIPAL
jgi:hypothetical protein